MSLADRIQESVNNSTRRDEPQEMVMKFSFGKDGMDIEKIKQISNGIHEVHMADLNGIKIPFRLLSNKEEMMAKLFTRQVLENYPYKLTQAEKDFFFNTELTKVTLMMATSSASENLIGKSFIEYVDSAKMNGGLTYKDLDRMTNGALKVMWKSYSKLVDEVNNKPYELTEKELYEVIDIIKKHPKSLTDMSYAIIFQIAREMIKKSLQEDNS